MQITEISRLSQDAWRAVAAPVMRLIGVFTMMVLLSNGTVLDFFRPVSMVVQHLDVDAVIGWLDRLGLTALLPVIGFVVIFSSFQLLDWVFMSLSKLIPFEVFGEVFPRWVANDDIVYVWKHFPRSNMDQLNSLVFEKYFLLKAENPRRYSDYWGLRLGRLERGLMALKSFVVVALLLLIMHLLVGVPLQFSWGWLGAIYVVVSSVGFFVVLGYARASTNVLYARWDAVIRHFSEFPNNDAGMSPEELRAAYDQIDFLKGIVRPIRIRFSFYGLIFHIKNSLGEGPYFK
ncbi:hypothetical protein ACIQUS_12535 [Pseudomonas sp. NPDC090755]|uniref:hypothetical protein n=1 Tax=Pseudomonas sp. NPDC090755 TaxID=3364481 RepID=UPI00383A7582